MVSWPGTVNTEPEMTVRHWTISDQNTSLSHSHQMQPSKTRTAFGNANFCQPQSTVVLLKRRNTSFSCDRRLHFLLRTCLLENILLILLFWERPEMFPRTIFQMNFKFILNLSILWMLKSIISHMWLFITISHVSIIMKCIKVYCSIFVGQ